MFKLDSKCKTALSDVINQQVVTKTYVDKVIRGVYRHGMLRGAPGLGKSHAVQEAFNNAGLVRHKDYVIVKGHCTPMQLFKILYAYRHRGQYVVLDDCAVESDNIGMDIIKAATDPDNSTVSWQSAAIPAINGEPVREFVFNGTMIICTNAFEKSDRQSRRNAKYGAILSRISPRDVDFNSPEKRFAQVYNMIVNYDYLNLDPNQRKLTSQEKYDLLQFIHDNLKIIGALDLRMPLKIAADIRDPEVSNWRKYCAETMLK